MESRFTNYRPLKAKLIFNPISGGAAQAPAQLLEILTELQALNIVPEVYLVEQGCDLGAVVQEAIRAGIRLIVVSGGDGTIDTVASAMVGTRATLGLIPTGTQNNVALSLGIPPDIPAAASLLRSGRRVKVDMGRAISGGVERWFLEACSVGLFSALFPAADDIQHGNLARLGDFLATLVSSPLAEMHLILDGSRKVDVQGHVILASNMPFVGPHYRVSPEVSLSDGLLDVTVFANLSKLDLISYAVQVVGGVPEDPRIQRYRAASLEVHTVPPMPVLVDGFPLEEGPLRIDVQRRALSVMIGGLEPASPLPGPNVIFEPEPDAPQ